MTDYLKHIKDPAWRIENLYKIIDKNANLIRFKRNPIQRKISASTAKRKLILKARQFGVTTNEMIKLLDLAIWGKNLNICILAHDQDTIKKVFKIIRNGYDSMAPELKPELDKGGGSAYELRFPKRKNTIFVALQVRGGTNHYLHISEGAFIPEDRLRATLETVPLDGHVTYESTPNGLNHYYDLWMDDGGKYEHHFYPWYLHEEYQIATPPLIWNQEEHDLARKAAQYGIELTHEQVAFRRAKLVDLKSDFYQEYPEDDQSCFLSSGGNPFDGMILKSLFESTPKVLEIDNQVKIMKRAELGKTYIIGCDPAEGVKRDYSVASVVCAEDREQVALFRSNTSNPSAFAEMIHYLGKLYSRRGKWPLAIVERNNHGHAVLLKLREDPDFIYPNLWLDSDGFPGHRTTSLTRPLLVDTFIEAVESKLFKINSKEILSECLTLVDNNGKIEAETGKHDDAVIATALAIKVAIEYLPKINVYKAANKSILV